jgi:hypothetical protein
MTMTHKTMGRRLTAEVGKRRAAAAQRAGKKIAVDMARPIETPAPKPTPAEAKPWVCQICGALTSEASKTCWKCKSPRGTAKGKAGVTKVESPPVAGFPASDGKAPHAISVAEPPQPISVVEYVGLERAFAWLRDRLFKPHVHVDLPDVVIVLTRRGGSKGHFASGRFSARADHKRLHEVSLNPDAAIGRTDKQIASTLAHEMCHLADQVLDPEGVGASEGYHRKQWAEIMLAIGLVPSHNEQPGGRMTGKAMSHYILPDGRFDRVMDELIATGWRLRLESTPRLEADKERTPKPRLACGLCGQQAGTSTKLAACCLPCLAQALSRWTDGVSLTDEERAELSDIVRDTALKIPEVAGKSGGASAQIADNAEGELAEAVP